ncbi:hypothetical protein GCM10023149_25950 [Mucilaginibacter gynuensis]|uniref:Uncharacterized protein n=1 Tax=Mucilaginibacter gynuensis TaxID=1302236 RepID=A0ABP8GH97_9SPHI
MKSVYLIFAIAVVVLIFLILGKIYHRQNLDLSFQGIIQKVEYSQNKGTPTITVNNVSYFLSGPIDFKYSIEVGDTIFKKKGEGIFKLTKKGSGKSLIFED